MTGALTGVRVLESTQHLAGPSCAMFLADMGAEVIKIERPGSGDASRLLGRLQNGESPMFMALNRNKLGITLNYKEPRAVRIFMQLAAESDIIVEYILAGVMDRLGLGYSAVKAVNRQIIYASISGFGQTGPYHQRGGYDTIAQGMSGIMSATGNEGAPPAKAGVPVIDIGTGLFTAYGILAAYINRQRTGEGQYLDMALLDCAISFSIWEAAAVFSGGETPTPMGSMHRRNQPHGAFKTKDGYFCVAADQQHHWKIFCELAGLDELVDNPRFATNRDRVENRLAMQEAIETALSCKTSAQWHDLLVAAGVPCGPVYGYDQVFDDPQVQHRQMAVNIDHPKAGPITITNTPLKLSQTPGQVRIPAPTLSQHTEEILKRLGYDDETIATYQAEQVV
ncbi:MAG: CaiB/BaiF CoA-transferase family protein [bacterium]|nr:CaiB/BaiF CoA-transferase family protein [bacterium]